MKRAKRRGRGDLAAIKLAIRKRLPPLEEARIYTRLLAGGDGKSQRTLSLELGVSQTRISQRMALLEMPAAIMKILEKPGTKFTERHARALRRINDPPLEVKLARRVVEENLTVRDIEDIVEDVLHTKGIRTRSLWSESGAARWRAHHDHVEVRVKGNSHAQQLKALKKFVEAFSRQSDS